MVDESGPSIEVTENGPYFVDGAVPISRTTIGVDENGEAASWTEDDARPVESTTLLCRCGHSGDKPYCDSSHAGVDFNGTETAVRSTYVERAAVLEGPGIVVTDVLDLCADAWFCKRHGGLWNTIADSDDPAIRDNVEDQARLCPSGRFVPVDKGSGEAIEPALPPSIGLVQDPQKGVSGGLWVRGRLPVRAADGYEYEVRNRLTLCRCGSSSNKPFCDGTHIEVGFDDTK